MHEETNNVIYIIKVKCCQSINGQNIEYDELIGESTSLDSAQSMQKNHPDAYIEIRAIQIDLEDST